MVCWLDAGRSDHDLIRGNILALTQWDRRNNKYQSGQSVSIPRATPQMEHSVKFSVICLHEFVFLNTDQNLK